MIETFITGLGAITIFLVATAISYLLVKGVFWAALRFSKFIYYLLYTIGTLLFIYEIGKAIETDDPFWLMLAALSLLVFYIIAELLKDEKVRTNDF